MKDKRVQYSGKRNKNSKIQISKKVQTTSISSWLSMSANDQTRSSDCSEQSHFRAGKEVSPVARTGLPLQCRMMNHMTVTSWLKRLKICAFFSSWSVLIYYKIVNHLHSNINSHLLVATILFLSCPSRLKNLQGRTVSSHTLLQYMAEFGVCLFFGILAVGKINKKKKTQKVE